MRKNLLAAIVLLVLYIPSVWAAAGYPVRGRVIDRLSREPVAYAAVTITGQPGKGAMTDSLGRFEILQVKPGIYSLTASFIGYRTVVTPEYQVSARTPFIEIEMEEEPEHLNEVVVRPSPFRRTIESPVSMQVIGMREIEKSPGSNRDVSRIVRSYPGVSFSPIGYRNDLIVRGGGPSENRFFMDGIEIPNINHFATQGATGGPVSIVNSDLVREINFYTGSFPADRAGRSVRCWISGCGTAISNGRPSRRRSVPPKCRSAAADTWVKRRLTSFPCGNPISSSSSNCWGFLSCPITSTGN